MDDSELIGVIKLFAGHWAPYGYEFCQGQMRSIIQYQALYALIGNRYGGDGKQTFALPDLRSHEPPEEMGLKYIICCLGGWPNMPY